MELMGQAKEEGANLQQVEVHLGMPGCVRVFLFLDIVTRSVQ